jgi:hypothetical protein
MAQFQAVSRSVHLCLSGSIVKLSLSACAAAMLASCGGGDTESTKQASGLSSSTETTQQAGDAASKALATAGTNAAQWTQIAVENQSFTVSGTQTVRYGTGTTWIEQTVTGTGMCSNGYFGRDPLYGIVKACEVASETSPPPPPPPPPEPSGEWTKIANEGEAFTLNASQNVRYGAGTSWVTRAVSGGTSRCDNAFFGRDPLYGVVKSCQVQTAAPPPNPPPTIGNITALPSGYVKCANQDTSTNCNFSGQVLLVFGTPGRYNTAQLTGPFNCGAAVAVLGDPAPTVIKDCFVPAAALIGAALPTKKLLEWGWDNPTPAQVKANAAAIEQSPFDGISVVLSSGANVFKTTALDARTFPTDEVALKTAATTKLKESFIVVYSGSDDAWDWFNDAHWAAADQNLRRFATVAKNAGMKGLALDPEPYSANPWSYPAQPPRGKTFEQMQAQVRLRGAQYMRAVQEVYPGSVVFSLFMFSQMISMVADNPSPAVLQQRLKEDTGSGLWPSFVNGMLDASPGNLKFVDGTEVSYDNVRGTEFDNYRARLVTPAKLFVDPALRDKYSRQLSVGHGLYLDGVMNLWKSPRFCGYYYQSDADRLKLLEHNVFHAMRSADEYAWLYAENASWWDSSKGAATAGTTSAVLRGKDKQARGVALDVDTESFVPAAKAACASTIAVYGDITGPDGKGLPGVQFKINGVLEPITCTSFNNASRFSCSIPGKSVAVIEPVLAGYSFTPPTIRYENLTQIQDNGFVGRRQ